MLLGSEQRHLNNSNHLHYPKLKRGFKKKNELTFHPLCCLFTFSLFWLSKHLLLEFYVPKFRLVLKTSRRQCTRSSDCLLFILFLNCLTLFQLSLMLILLHVWVSPRKKSCHSLRTRGASRLNQWDLKMMTLVTVNVGGSFIILIHIFGSASQSSLL